MVIKKYIYIYNIYGKYNKYKLIGKNIQKNRKGKEYFYGKIEKKNRIRKKEIPYSFKL